MKTTRSTRYAAAGLFALLFALPLDAWAQDRALRIRRVEGQLVRAPQYQVTAGTRTVRQRQWMEIRTQYETAPDWISEMTFTYYIVLRNRRPGPGEQEHNLFRGDVTYVNVARGRHESTVFLHPSTVERYGDLDRVAIVITSQGQVLGMESNPSSQERWWERLPPRAGFVLNRMQTPFAMVNFDDYEAIKVE